MQPKKKAYEKPRVRTIKMLEVGSALCCKASLATCTSSNRITRGKGTRTSTVS